MKRLLLLNTLLLVTGIQLISQNKPVEVPILVRDGKEVPQEAISAARELRNRLLSDPYRPAFHFCIPEGNGRPGDPNGAFFANGRYHLMFLYNRADGFSWGHVSSKDLVSWRYHPDAIFPGDGDDGCFSGGAFVDDDGSAVLSYWMLWGAKGIGLAKSKDSDFNVWEKSRNNPVIKSTEWGITDTTDASGKEVHYGSADPSNIWKKDGHYYILTGNLLLLRKFGSRGTGLPANDFEKGPPLPADSVSYQGDHLSLFVSDDLKQWKYVHDFYKSDRSWTSKTEDNMCPSFLPLPSDPEGGKASGKHLLLFISHNKGCQYYTGTYKDDHFYPEIHGRMTWIDNAYFAPEALVDDKGRQIMWSWIFDDRPDSVINYSGWTGMYGLPRSLWLGSDGTLRMRPVKELESLRMKEEVVSGIKVSPGGDHKLNGLGKELQELEIMFLPSGAVRFGVKVCSSGDGREETVIYYDSSDGKLKFDTRKSGLAYGRKIIEEAPLDLKRGEPLVLRIFIDKSVAEVYANDRQAIARMIYPTLGGHEISLFSEGGATKVKSIRAWELSPSNPY
jgi:beta-fructofuranosidase